MARPVTIAPVIYALIRYTMNAQSVMMTDVADKLGIGITYLSDMLSGWSPLNDEKLAIIFCNPP